MKKILLDSEKILENDGDIILNNVAKIAKNFE